MDAVLRGVRLYNRGVPSRPFDQLDLIHRFLACFPASIREWSGQRDTRVRSCYIETETLPRFRTATVDVADRAVSYPAGIRRGRQLRLSKPAGPNAPRSTFPMPLAPGVTRRRGQGGTRA